MLELHPSLFHSKRNSTRSSSTSDRPQATQESQALPRCVRKAACNLALSGPGRRTANSSIARQLVPDGLTGVPRLHRARGGVRDRTFERSAIAITRLSGNERNSGVSIPGSRYAALTLGFELKQPTTFHV